MSENKPSGREERFWAKVERHEPDECWPWRGAIKDNGYGAFFLGRIEGKKRQGYAHRFAYELLRGPIPSGFQIDHLCRNRDCVNPAHLEAVTQQENVLRGESLPAQRARQTHCHKGHPLSGDNLYEWGGRRYCRTCRRAVAST